MKNIFYEFVIFASVCYDDLFKIAFSAPTAFSAHWIAPLMVGF